MKVLLDAERCQRNGMCQMSAPELFELSEDDGFAVLLHPEAVPEGQESAATLAVNNCPERALTVVRG